MNFHSSSAFQSISAIAYLVIGFMAGLAVALLTGITTASLPLPSPQIDAAATTMSIFPPDSGDVAVSNQPAGVSVLVDSVTVPPPGVWVAVQDVNEDGTLGNVLGAALVGHPESNVSVALLRNTLPGQKYAVVLYRDDGDGQFELGSDSLYVDFDTGQPAEELFKTDPAGETTK
jgi:hypothetical protein